MKHILVLILLMGCFLLQGQNKKTDSLWAVYHNTSQADTSRLKALQAIAWSRRFNKPDTTIILSKQVLDLAVKSKQRKYEGEAMYTLSTALRVKGDFNTATEWCEKALAVFEEIRNKMGIGNCFSQMGNLSLQKSDFPKALEWFLKAQKAKEEIGDKQGIGNCYGSIGNVYSIQSNFPKALEYELKALKIMEELGNKPGMGNCYSSIGIVYKEQNNYPKALEYYAKDLEIKTETGNISGMLLCYANMANTYLSLADYPKALEYFQLDLKLCREISDKRGTATVYCNMSDLYTRMQDYKLALAYADSGLKSGLESGDITIQRFAYQNLSTASAKLNRYKEAYENEVLFKKMTDSIFNVENSQQIGDMKTKFEVEKKEVELKAKSEAEKDKLKVIANEEGKRQRLITYSVGGGLLLVLFFSIFIFNRLPVTRKQKAVIEKQKTLVEEQKLEVENQKHRVEEHRQEILDSITYAKRLQQAILPTFQTVKEYLPHSFIYYQPKDIVAGDFYWMEHFDGLIFIAAADSTGHGVPGALVSIVCSNALNRAVKEFALRDTGKILDKTRELVLETFARSSQEVKDGMDISLLALHPARHKAYWSGANNPLWYCEDGQMKEVKADKQPIGMTEHASPFTTHHLSALPGSIFYLLTDGYPDQFGGPKGKKFKYKQLEDLLVAGCAKPMEEQKENLSSVFEDWKGGLEQVDDVTIIGIRI
jgi:serine phosphatase RsbU (regulator of sigma subunit)